MTELLVAVADYVAHLADGLFGAGLGFFFASQSPIKHFSRLWTMFCILVFVVLFVIFDGWQQLAIQFEVLLRTMSVSSFSINLLMLASILFGLLFVGVEESVSRA